MNWIKDSIKVVIVSLILFLLTDLLLTWGHEARGVSKFYISNVTEGRHNKPGFSDPRIVSGETAEKLDRYPTRAWRQQNPRFLQVA